MLGEEFLLWKEKLIISHYIVKEIPELGSIIQSKCNRKFFMKVKNLFSVKSSDLFSHTVSGCNFNFPVFKNSAPYVKLSYTVPLVFWK